MKKLENEILVCQGDVNLRMSVKTDGETVWLTQEQMCQLFGRDRRFGACDRVEVPGAFGWDADKSIMV